MVRRPVAWSLPLLFATTAASAGPAKIAKGPWVQRVGPTSAIVRVEVEPAMAASIEVGIGLPDGPAGHHVVESSEPRALHAVTLEGLTPATHYAYAVRAGGSSKLATFTTAP